MMVDFGRGFGGDDGSVSANYYYRKDLTEKYLGNRNNVKYGYKHGLVSYLGIGSN